LLAPAVVRVLLVLKTNTALVSPCASSVNVPVIEKAPDEESYTPGVFVVPPSSAPITAVDGSPLNALYAVERSFFA
jgi:hypothetical protein